jgi:CubicO group peptidase (beta-lactamase class C family)
MRTSFGIHVCGPLLMLVFAASTGSGCSPLATWPDADALPVPAPLGDGWAVGTAESQGIDPRSLLVLDHDIRSGRIEEVDALLIARNGVLVYEGYYHPATAVDTFHQLNSVSKSVTSILMGVAARKGLIEGFDQSIESLFPELADVFAKDPAKRSLTLRHVLTMTSGLAWDRLEESNREQDGFYVRRAPDAARYVLEKPLEAEPGSRFLYSNGSSLVLAAALRNVAGMQADAFAREELFGPLGIGPTLWQHLDDGIVDSGGGLFMRGRDLLKLGQLYLGQGQWQGHQLVARDWIEASLHPWTTTDWATSRYGFQWWMYPWSPAGQSTGRYGLVAGSGYGGQKLFLVPELDLVVVFFGCTTEGYDCGISDTVPEAIMYNYILPAITVE